MRKPSPQQVLSERIEEVERAILEGVVNEQTYWKMVGLRQGLMEAHAIYNPGEMEDEDDDA